MSRKKITLAFIKDNTNRKASFRKRRKGLIKKVREISTLCDVDACAITFSPYDQTVEVWPSPEGALAVLARYGAISGRHPRPGKEMDPESFTLQRIKKTRRKTERLCNQNKRSDLELVMYRCMAGMERLDNLDVRDWAEMGRSINQMIRDVQSKLGKFMTEGVGCCDSQAAMAPPPPVAPMDPPPLPPPIGPEYSGLDWDIGALLYPH
ncbi:mads-box transcription factor pheres 2 [Phtheirospermum japonicum]|uniref:Mads-box transcription factor pheres 2 n=1 Tax=Phtheirospermum japonicum TaxID=374723 RepID=A0A830D341_9LAMI|nr:mads-box transcription factor pheres 2 [Phtheirospermum japonicum]